MASSRALIRTAHHEAAHAVLFVVLDGRAISFVEIGQGSGLTKCIPRKVAPPIPSANERRALNALAISLSGAIAHARVYGDPIADDDALIRQHGGDGDLEALAFQLACICKRDLAAMVSLRARAFAHAVRMVEGLWPEITEVADALLRARIIGDAEVRRAIARATPESRALLPVATKSRVPTLETKDLERQPPRREASGTLVRRPGYFLR